MTKQENIKRLKELFIEFEKELESSPDVEKIKQGSVMYLDDDGIIHMELKGNMDSIMKYSDVIMKYSEKYKDEIKESLEIKVLAKVPPIFKMPPIAIRKKIKESLTRSQEMVKIQKMAMCGGGTITKTVLSFILVALGMKNVKHFDSEEKALKWLKKD